MTNGGGPAFPCDGYTNDGEGFLRPAKFPGMSLRDYFAAQAVPVIISQRNAPTIDPASVAKQAYTMADAMLKEREK